MPTGYGYQRWNHSAQERRIIRRKGGRPLRKYGTDGTLRGRPVEVRSVRKGDRYRIQRNTHREMIQERGSYIFVNRAERSRRVPARRVSRMLGNGPWYKDRSYPHKFVRRRQVFKR